MEESLKTILKDVPALGLMAVIVIVFLKYLTQRDQLLRDISEKSDVMHARAIEAIERSSEANGRSAAIMEVCVRKMKSDDLPPTPRHDHHKH